MEKFEGIVENIIFQNKENGYTVAEIMSGGSSITIVGFLFGIGEGTAVSVEGTWTEHPTFGRQFKCTSFNIVEPDDELAIERYLGSGAIKGVGVSLAARIVRRFGIDAMKIISEEPERLAEIKGISMRLALSIAQQVEENKGIQQAMMFLQKFNISQNMAVKIYGKYGERVYSIIRENPYKLAEDVDGIGFKTADEIAMISGIALNSDFRVQSGIVYTLRSASAEGHTYLPEDELIEKAAEILDVTRDDITKNLTELSIQRKIVRERADKDETRANSIGAELADQDETRANSIGIEHADNNEASPNSIGAEHTDNNEEPTRIYDSYFFNLERNVARMLHELNGRVENDIVDIDKTISKIEKATGKPLANRQRQALIQAVTYGLVVITGGPGTGKTTTIDSIIHYFDIVGLDFVLAAPTGRAAKRMSEATGYEAKTIHRLLEVGSESEGFNRDETNPLEADAVIIDEVSMVDLPLMNALLKAIIPGTRLILVGDANQLPSVGPGRVLFDIISSGQIPVVELTEIFRQAATSDIIMNAHRINKGENITLDNKSKDFFFLKRADTEQIINVTLSLVLEKMPDYVKCTPNQVQILTPMRRGNLGVEHLNEVLQRFLNPDDKTKTTHERGQIIFREGDKVMQTKNDYNLEWEIRGKYGIPVDSGKGVFNGDVGTIRTIDTFTKMITVEYDDGRMVDYTFQAAEELEHAYALTVHKSQGSEYPVVVIPLLGTPRLLQTRNLIYTAVTRAKSCVVIVGSEEEFCRMVANADGYKRYSGLRDKLCQEY